jgi:predicted SprT family Zn-dependent metalloprotease
MNLVEADKQAKALMFAHGLTTSGWKIEWGSAKNRAGVCYSQRRMIRFSTILLRAMTDDEAVDVITHEIAHALAGHAAGHGPEWVATHKRLGGSGNRLWTSPTAKAAKDGLYKWHAVDAVSGRVLAKRHRLTERYRYATCKCHGMEVRWIEQR